MKRIYATILLVSFMTGALQPVLPMVHFSMDGGELTNIVAPGFFDNPYSSKGQFCSVKLNPFQDCDENNLQSLLDTDYYPLPVNVDNARFNTILNVQYAGYITLKQNTFDLYLYSGTPPPRVV